MDADYLKRRALERAFEEICVNCGFEGIETPIFESRELFVRSVGETTDIVQKELFNLEKKSRETYSLRPELTAGVIRSQIESGLRAKRLPILIYSAGKIFRYGKPQRGRLREFNQLGIEILSPPSPYLDAYGIAVAARFFEAIGLSEKIIFNLNTLGSAKTKGKYSAELKSFLGKKSDILCPDCRQRQGKNPLRALDCKVPSCVRVVAQAPMIDEFLSEEEKTYFKKINEALEGLSVNFRVDPSLIRGLDYYTGVVFEVNLASDAKRDLSLGGGGRYDDLVRELGGGDLGAFGFGIGLERTALAAEEIEKKEPIELMIIPLGEAETVEAIKLQRKASSVVSSKIYFKNFDLKSALSAASAEGCRWALIIGEKEMKSGKYTLKDLSTARQKQVDKDAGWKGLLVNSE